MWFKLAGATFTNNLGTMDSISKSYMMDYSGLTGLSASPGSVSYATDSTPDATITFTVKSGYVFKSGSKVTASGGASKTYTASADIAAGSTFTMALTGITGKVTFSGAAELVSGGNTGGSGGSEPDTPVNPPSDGTMTLKAYFDSVNAPTTVYKFLDGTVSWVGGKNYRHCIIPLSSGISHVKIATGTEENGVAGLLYLSSNTVTATSIIEAVYGTNTTWITNANFRGLSINITPPEGATHIAIGEFINKETIGCTDNDLILTFGSGGGGSTDDPVDDPNNTSTFMTSVGTTPDTYKYDGTSLTMVNSSSSVQHYRHVIVPVADYNITHLCCLTGSSGNNIGPVLFLSGSELKAENVIDSKLGTISDSSIVLNTSFRLFDEDITIPSGCTHMAWIDYQPITNLLDTSNCNYTVTYN